MVCIRCRGIEPHSSGIVLGTLFLLAADLRRHPTSASLVIFRLVCDYMNLEYKIPQPSRFPPMNEARSSHLPFWGPSEGFFLINQTSVGLTRMKRSSFGLRVRVNPWVNLDERFIRVNPTDVWLRTKPPHWDPKTASGLNALRSFRPWVINNYTVRRSESKPRA